MSESEYLRRILPATPGLYCAARLLPSGGFANTFFPTIEAVHACLAAWDARGETVYVAQAVFDEAAVHAAQAHNNSLPKGAPKTERKGRRTQANALALKSFFFDLDCGPTKPFPTQLDAVKALRSFVRQTKLPTPIIESSGNGLYARWIMTEDVSVLQWRLVGFRLKQLAQHYKFEIDPARTSDSASVLRPMGSHNRKNPDNPKLARLITDAPDVPFFEFAVAVESALKSVNLPVHGLTPPQQYTGLNDSFASGIGEDHPPSDPLKVVARCNAARVFVAKRGDVSEPYWYDMIGVLRFCTNGEEALQEWSAGHHDYSPAATADKIEHHKNSGVGPTSCQKIGQTSEGACIGCAQNGKVRGPITLGYPESKVVEMAETEQHTLPDGYLRTEDGLFIKTGEVKERFYPYDLYPVSYAKDHTIGKEVVTIRHKMPFTSAYAEFTLPTELLHDGKALMQHLINNHVHVTGDSGKTMMGYLHSYMQSLREKRRLIDLHPQMGWSQEDGKWVFILGTEIFRKGEAPMQAGLARSAPVVATAFKSVGTVEGWCSTTSYLAQPGMESLGFAFLAGAFGAPLMHFTGHSGAMVSMVGRSGLGKTMTGKWALSAYGDPEALTLQKDDTPASMISRLGIYGSLPAYIDEISNMEAGPLSDLVYRITQGRERNRLTQKGEEKQGRTTWKTLTLCSSNHPLIDRLAALKADASAEINRLLELHVTTPAGFGSAHCRHIFKTFEANHGAAGRLFIQYLVDNQDVHREKLEKLTEELERRSGALPEERFWIAIAAITVYGGLIAKKLGLVTMDITAVMEWIISLIKMQRTTRNDMVTTYTDVLGQFLDASANGILVTGRDAAHGMAALLREPRGELCVRIFNDQNRMLIGRAQLRTFLAKHYASYSALKQQLTELGALINTDARRVLGSGTHFAGTATPCWEIDLTVPALGRQVARLVSAAPVAALKEGRG